jgi:hypothetical protein
VDLPKGAQSLAFQRRLFNLRLLRLKVRDELFEGLRSIPAKGRRGSLERHPKDDVVPVFRLLDFDGTAGKLLGPLVKVFI